MGKVRFIKSFSKGQITIPKEFRESIGLKDEFWLKLYIENKKIIAEPVEKERTSLEYLQSILKISGSWFSVEEYTKTRKAVEEKVRKSAL